MACQPQTPHCFCLLGARFYPRQPIVIVYPNTTNKTKATEVGRTHDSRLGQHRDSAIIRATSPTAMLYTTNSTTVITVWKHDKTSSPSHRPASAASSSSSWRCRCRCTFCVPLTLCSTSPLSVGRQRQRQRRQRLAPEAQHRRAKSGSRCLLTFLRNVTRRASFFAWLSSECDHRASGWKKKKKKNDKEGKRERRQNNDNKKEGDEEEVENYIDEKSKE